MGQDSYIKIEWAKDYFGPDVIIFRPNNKLVGNRGWKDT